MAKKFRFSLRSLLFLVTLCAVLLGWWADHRRLTQRMRDLEEEMMIKQAIQSGEMTEVDFLPSTTQDLQGPEVPDNGTEP